jgi:cell surface protein
MKQLYLLLITLLVSLSAYAERSGTCGANLKWKLTDEGVLTITGTGEMYNWEDGHAKPWSRNSNIKQVIIGDGVTTIGEEAFSFCYSLESITIPNSVTTIGESAFKACSSLTLITIPNSVTTIGGRAFDSCRSLTSITISNSVTTIGGGAFYKCRSLTSITIPKNVTTIGIHAFYDCRSLTSITIPNSVTTIGYYAFSGCKNVKQITVEAVTPPECSTNTFDGVNTKECKLIVPKNSVDAYKKADGWKEFFLIEGITTGIINNIYNKIENVDVYTIDGVKCLSKANVNEINALPKGVYIINGKKIIIK